MTTLQQQHSIDFQSFVFDYARGFDEARGLGRPQIGTAGRDLEMWRALEGKATSSRLKSNAGHSCPPPLRGGVGSVGVAGAKERLAQGLRSRCLKGRTSDGRSTSSAIP